MKHKSTSSLLAISLGCALAASFTVACSSGEKGSAPAAGEDAKDRTRSDGGPGETVDSGGGSSTTVPNTKVTTPDLVDCDKDGKNTPRCSQGEPGGLGKGPAFAQGAGSPGSIQDFSTWRTIESL